MAMQIALFSGIGGSDTQRLNWRAPGKRVIVDVYNDVLNRSLVASGTRTAGEEEQYQKAMTFLYEVTDDGLRVPSREAAKYQEFYDAMIVLREQFSAQKVDAELSEDADLEGSGAKRMNQDGERQLRMLNRGGGPRDSRTGWSRPDSSNSRLAVGPRPKHGTSGGLSSMSISI